MGLIELFLLAVGLSMDAFAVAVCKGLVLKSATARDSALVGLWFGGFQALMPVIGYLLGSRFYNYIVSIDHWIAFFLLSFIGVSMIREARSRSNEDSGSLDPRSMFILAIATSIDALAVGITFAFLDVNVIFAASLIGVTTFLLSFFGVKFGSIFGEKYRAGSQIAGGSILIILGFKILLEHLGTFK